MHHNTIIINKVLKTNTKYDVSFVINTLQFKSLAALTTTRQCQTQNKNDASKGRSTSKTKTKTLKSQSFFSPKFKHHYLHNSHKYICDMSQAESGFCTPSKNTRSKTNKLYKMYTIFYAYIQRPHYIHVHMCPYVENT